MKPTLCDLLGHEDDGRGDLLNKCPRCGKWSVRKMTQLDSHVRMWRAHHLLRAQLIASVATAG